jgi:hypothetical protein
VSQPGTTMEALAVGLLTEKWSALEKAAKEATARAERAEEREKELVAQHVKLTSAVAYSERGKKLLVTLEYDAEMMHRTEFVRETLVKVLADAETAIRVRRTP